MKHNNITRLLQEYISEVLREDQSDGGGGGGGGYYDTGGMNNMGQNPYGTGSNLFNAFIKPFADVASTVVGQTKELTRRAATVVHIAFEAIMVELFPFLEGSWKEIFDKEKEDLAKIKSEYQDVYDATNNALKSDAAVLAFLAFPGPVIASKVINGGPKAASKLLNVMTGGLFSKAASRASSKTPGSTFESYLYKEKRYLLEDKKDEDKDKDKDKKKKDVTMDDIIGNEKFINSVLEKSPKVVAMKKMAYELHQKTIKTAFEQASGVLNAKSIDQIEKITGKKLPGTDKLNKLQPAEKKAAEQQLLSNAKASMKKFYSAHASDEAKKLIDAGVPDSHPFVKTYNNLANKIKSL